MGISREQAAENREAIVSAADRLFRERGVDAVGLTALMKEAGFTQGGFYNHFKSKDALVSAVMARAMAANEVRMAQGMGEASAFAASGDRAVPSKVGVEQYLSTVHRDDVACGCPVAGFAGAVPRIGEEAQACNPPNNPSPATMIDPATGQPVAAPVPANGQVAGQPMPGQPVPGQPVQGQAMPGQAMPGQPAMRPVQNNSTGTADGASNR